MKQKFTVTLPIVFDDDYCDECHRLFHASYGWFCTAYDQMVDKTEEGFERCPNCKLLHPTEPVDAKIKETQQTLF